MKRLSFFATLIVAAISLCMSACNSGSDKKADEKMADTSTTKPTTTETVTAPSGPSSLVIVIHEVSNYAKWEPLYEGDDSSRLNAGLHNYVLARGTEDSNKVLLVFKMDDVEKAKAFASSRALKDKMQKGGVKGAPTVDFLEAVMNDTTAITQTVRLMMRHKVKDWDAWKKEFDSHKQVRADAGLIDRALGHTVGDTHNVTIVFAVSDMEKAKAFLASKDLKDKMTAAGVEGMPTSFFYRVVKKY